MFVDDETIGAVMVVKRVVTCIEEAIQGMIGVCFSPGPPFQERQSHSISSNNNLLTGRQG